MNPRQHADETIEANRYAVLNWSALQILADGSEVPIAFVVGDDVLWKIATSEGGASLVALNRTPNGNGSKVTIDEFGDTSDPDSANWTAASGRVLIDAVDTALLATTRGVVCYDELILQDSGDANRLKTICRGRIIVKPSQS